MHTTSLNIRQDIFELMEVHALRMNITITELIKRLIARFSKRYTSRLEYRECSVAYQPLKKQGHLFIITYTDQEYEQVLDLRKVWKLSVSFFVMMAFLHYLYSFSTGNQAESRKVLKNSYMFKNYFFHKNITNSIITFILIWGQNQAKHLKE